MLWGLFNRCPWPVKADFSSVLILNMSLRRGTQAAAKDSLTLLFRYQLASSYSCDMCSHRTSECLYLHDPANCVIHPIVQLCDMLSSSLQMGAKAINVLDALWRYGVEAIGRTGLDYSFDAFEPSKRNRYADSVKDLL